MKLGTKIVVAAIGAVTLTVVIGLVVQRHIIREQGIELTRSTMRAAVVEAENVRESVSALNQAHAFDSQTLLAEFKKNGDLRGSTLYQTIPVVAAWKAIEKVSEKEGFEFRVPKHQARNPQNNPTPAEETILTELETGKAEEYFQVDTARNQLVYARPIILTADCLVCHGDPKTSPTGDGKDMLGFQMENWKAGEVHGAFVLKASLDRVDKVVAAGIGHTLLWIGPLAVVIAIGFFFLNRFLIVRPLGDAMNLIDSISDQTAASAEQVSTASQTLAEGSSQQAASIEETSASLEELSSMTKRNAENSQKANDLSKQTRAAADKGVNDMQAMNAAMAAIKVSSDDIAKIIKTIDEIAFQTNILALNAAVEAARAGEAGMGFAVVADEVRNLAQRSAQAAKETAAKIEGAITKTAQGVELSGKVSEALNDIVTKARQVDELAAEVAGASREQTQGITQINVAVSEMDKVTQSNAASAEESAAAAEELNSQALTMKHSVVGLQELIGGNVQKAATKTKAAPRHAKAKEIYAIKHVAKHSAPVKSNGHARAITPMANGTKGRGEIPMDGDFKDF